MVECPSNTSFAMVISEVSRSGSNTPLGSENMSLCELIKKLFDKYIGLAKSRFNKNSKEHQRIPPKCRDESRKKNTYVYE